LVASHGFAGGQLKIIQEIITMSVLAVFAMVVLREPLTWRYLGVFTCIAGAAACMLVGRHKTKRRAYVCYGWKADIRWAKCWRSERPVSEEDHGIRGNGSEVRVQNCDRQNSEQLQSRRNLDVVVLDKELSPSIRCLRGKSSGRWSRRSAGWSSRHRAALVVKP